MSRTKGSSGPKTLQAIRHVGLKLIYRHGYGAMSLRDLAAEVGIQQGSLYNHIASKQDLLFGLMREHLDSIARGVDEDLSGMTDVLDRLKAFIAFHLTYHMERKSEVYINNSELRSLEPKNLAVIKAMREAYEARLIEILKDGAKQKRLHVDDATVTAFALIALLTGICNWYQPKGKLGKAKLVQLHTDLALNGLLATPSPDR